VAERVARLAAVKACGSDALLNHFSAAALWGLVSWDERRPEVTVTGSGTRAHPRLVNVPLKLTGRRVIPDFRWPRRRPVIEADGAAGTTAAWPARTTPSASCASPGTRRSRGPARR